MNHLLRAACLAVLLAAPPAAAQEVVLKVHHFLPPPSTGHQKVVMPWCERIGKASAGRMKCQVFPAMQMGGTPAQLYDQAKDGVADVVWTVTGYTAGRFPKTEVFELPFIMTDPEATARAMWDFAAGPAAEEFADVQVLALHPHGGGVLHVAKKPVRTLADFRGLKLRAPTRLTTRMLAAFGATPVGMPVPQVAESLSKGVIDGAVLPWEVVPALKVQELVKFHSELDKSQPALYTTVFVLAMNKARYASLPLELKKIIDAESGPELSARAARAFLESDANGRATASGNTIFTLPAAEVEAWRKAAQPVTDGWVKDMNGRGADGSALLATARELIAKRSR